MENKKGNKILIVMFIISLLIIFAMALYIVFDKKSVSTSNNKTNSGVEEEIVSQEEQTKENSNISNNTEEQSSINTMPKCTGTYYGETQGVLSNGLTYNYQYKYILNTDGTFTASFGEASATSGVYVINDNTISLISKKETTGPRDQDPYYVTADYVIADDCSYINVNDGSVSFKLNRQ